MNTNVLGVVTINQLTDKLAYISLVDKSKNAFKTHEN